MPAPAASANRRRRLAAITLWLLILGGVFTALRSRGWSYTELAQWLYAFIETHPLAPVLYLLVYLLRTILLAPAAMLNILAGSLFGFWQGWLLALIGENLSANLAYAIGRYLSDDGQAIRRTPFMRRWGPRLDEHGVATVVVLRALYLPLDLVNYGCGALAVPWHKYAIGTAIGTLPPMLTFLSLGASVDLLELLENPTQWHWHSVFDGRQLLISLGLLAASIGGAVLLHRRHHRRHHQAGRP